jgi:F-box protein, helicase, 18
LPPQKNETRTLGEGYPYGYQISNIFAGAMAAIMTIMELTKEQYDIIHSTGNIKINAVAGSGKTTTVIEYAKARPKNSKILYLAFNKSVKLEAVKKFADAGLTNVRVETAHSLAYKHIVYRHGYTVRPQGYKTSEIAEMLTPQSSGEKHADHIAANHVSKFITYFCNSDKQKVQDLNYLDVVTDSKARTFVKNYYPYIEQETRLLLDKMNKGAIDITHDFYLKKYQLCNPVLHFDYILFDEGQDASPAMLDVFLKQQATKVIVGDTHQQIYGWRFAVNSLEKADFTTFHLSTSFRFSQDIANLAMEVLSWKSHIEAYTPIPVTGKGKPVTLKSRAVLARTNLGLLLKAIEYITEKAEINNIYFEGNINSYTYADEGASLYDVLNLYNTSRHLIKDKLIRAMNNLDELEEYIEKTEDVQLGMMVEIVKQYGNKIPGLIKQLKEKHIDSDEKEKAEIIFSTVHRCKGMEYDAIHLVNDFITEQKLVLGTGGKTDATDADFAKLNEEINLLYVAVTRTRNDIYIPAALLPEGFPASPQIHIVKELSEEEKKKAEFADSRLMTLQKIKNKTGSVEKAYTIEGVRQQHSGAYQPWTDELDEELTVMFCKGKSINEMAVHFGRTKGAINSRIKKLELRELYG